MCIHNNNSFDLFLF